MTLSIIIPIYNAEDTLECCLDSVLSQNVDSYEIILVDDGSTDSSGSIADRWAARENNIKVYHKSNGGPSDARNYGLERVTGNYVTFIDSDDEIELDTLQPLLDILQTHPEYDILEYSVYQNIGHHDKRRINLDNHVYCNAIDWLAANGCQRCWMWNKVFRREQFDNLRFPQHLHRFEDIWMMGELLKRNPVIATTSYGKYWHYWNENGLMAGKWQYSDLTNAQTDLIRKLGIDTRQRRWHKLYMDMYNIQLYVYIQTGRIIISPQKVAPRAYDGIQGLVKSLALDILGLKLSCKLFKFFIKNIKNNRYQT